MSEPLTPERLAEIRERVSKARDYVRRLCQPACTEGKLVWAMHIPADPDDPDLVIAAGLDCFRDLLAEVDRLRAADEWGSAINKALMDSQENAVKERNKLRDWQKQVCHALRLLDSSMTIGGVMQRGSMLDVTLMRLLQQATEVEAQ